MNNGLDRLPARRSWAVLLLALLLLCGCGGGSSKQLDRCQTSIESWSATLTTTVEQWGQGRLPRGYVRQILEAGNKALAAQARKLDRADSGDGQRDALMHRLNDLRGRFQEVSRTVARDDVAGARAILQTEGRNE